MRSQHKPETEEVTSLRALVRAAQDNLRAARESLRLARARSRNRITRVGDVVRMEIGRGQIATLDAGDLPLVQVHTRKGQRIRRRRDAWYAITNVPAEGGRQRQVFMHKIIFPDAPMLDHADGNGLNNRRSNLRRCTQSQNSANSIREPGRSGYRGVCRGRGARWKASIGSRGEKRHLGTFNEAAAAARAYDAAARETYGEFARLNFPNPGERHVTAGR